MATPRPSARLDLNVTPLIDVLLVLLVIFMAALPLAQQGLDTTVPKNTQARADEPQPDQIVVQVTADGQLSINRQPVTASELLARAASLHDARLLSRSEIADGGRGSAARAMPGRRRVRTMISRALGER